MNNHCSYLSCIHHHFLLLPLLLLLCLSVIPLCYSQNGYYITQPTLTQITPLNSTAFTITWQFANSSFDQSDLILIYIGIFAFYNGYNSTWDTTNYTFTTNKTITSLTKNYDFVNAFYLVCFSSNSTLTNVTQFVALSTCQLTRTCTRSNSSVCPKASFITVLPTQISSNSFIITVYLLNSLPYTLTSTQVQLINTNTYGTQTGTTYNTTYIIQSFLFSNQQPKTTYTVNTIVNYTIFTTTIAETYNFTLTTSRSSILVCTSDRFIFGASIFAILLMKVF
ncbi:unnamed protein product [Adineta steineri]|uniref:Uncharacterized protein n=1 Tax=Adineta steineri TaxID=433720 RepID=A0A815EEX2_9BILA|nr:unnamed protein product [Adineta steineri]CAF1579120.1 unnamed protein product [Adineta steineri]